MKFHNYDENKRILKSKMREQKLYKAKNSYSFFKLKIFHDIGKLLENPLWKYNLVN